MPVNPELVKKYFPFIGMLVLDRTFEEWGEPFPRSPNMREIQKYMHGLKKREPERFEDLPYHGRDEYSNLLESIVHQCVMTRLLEEGVGVYRLSGHGMCELNKSLESALVDRLPKI